jgi:Glycosyltransferase like family
MIVFASAVTSPDTYGAYAAPGIALAAERDSESMPRAATGSIFATYNAILEEACEIEELEALVLLHQDAQIEDPEFCAKLRTALADPDVGVVGCVGSIGVRSIAWWEGSVTWASFIHRYTELGGGDVPSLTWNEADRPPYARLGEVDSVDGFVLGLSPWVVRNVRFDESLGQALHGYDFDFCLQVRETGHKVVTADFKVIHNHSLQLASDLEHWSQAHIAIAEKWDGRMPGVGSAGGSWKHRARRAEAEAAVTRAVAHSTQMKIAVRAAEHRRELEVMTTSIGWRLTAPLRLAGRYLTRRRSR